MAEDSDNALLSGGYPRSAPVYVNPAASMGRGMAIAGKAYDLREKQAQEAAGQAFLNSIDPATGQPNQALLLQNLRKDPNTAMAAQTSAQSGVTLDTGTQDLKMKRLTGINAAAMALTAQYPNGVPQSAVNDELDRLGPTFGLTPEQIAEAKRSFGADPAANSRTLIRNSISNLNAQDALHAAMPQRAPLHAGGEILYPDVNPVTNPAGPGSVRTSATPEQQGNLVSVPIPVDKDGNYTSDPSKVVRYDNKNIPRQFLPGLPMPGGPGTQPQGPQPRPGATGGSSTPQIPVAPGAPAGTQPGRIRPAPGSPLLNPSATPAPGAATPPSQAPSSPQAPVAPASAPTAATPPVAPGVTTGPGGVPMVAGGPPQGQPEKLKADVDAYTRDQAAIPDVTTRAQNMAHAYEALELLRSSTGKGAAGINEVRSRLQTLGLLPAGAVSEQKLMEIFTKYTERAMIDAAGGASTDLGRRMSEQANAGTLLSTPANLEILRNDMGKTLQTIAAYKAQESKDGVGYLEHRAKIADTTDPRGFVWNLYSQAEQSKILAGVKDDKVADAKLHRAIGMSQVLNLQIPSATLRPPPQKQSYVAPRPQERNALAMAG